MTVFPSYLRLVSATIALVGTLSACVQKAPPDLLEAIDSLDRRLVEIKSAEFAPEEYASFVKHWVAMKGRLLAEEDVIRWPWEPNQLVADLRKVREEGEKALGESLQRRDAERLTVESRLAMVEVRFLLFTGHVQDMGSRAVLGRRPIETELLVRQARSFFEQGLFSRSESSVRRASRLMDDQAAILTSELGHYANERKVQVWRQMAHRTVEWSRVNRASAIVVSKADRRLMLYRNGRQVMSYPVRLGYNGILEKRYQGDGATPEGHYRVIRKRDRGQTQFYRALLLDYPNGEDRRRFHKAQRRGMIPHEAFIGGQIEIHGSDDEVLSKTLGCIMLDNKQIDALFEGVDVGTPVTIVGAIQRTNSIALALAELERSEEG
jgi:lipoprotein-anchoring transpeptidase ErfK/SrfK